MNKLKKPFNSFYLKVDKKNEIYVRQYGNNKGVPIFILHGGPGGAYSGNKISKKVNLKYTNLIVIDQRGCGLSRPNLSIHKTTDLISDIKKVKEYLNLKKFIITGGSWGATLSLLYTLKYPKDIISYVLASGVYQVEKSIWPRSFFTMYPDEWEKFCKLVKINQKDIRNPTMATQKKICKLFFNKIKNLDKKYIKAWFELEHDIVWTYKPNLKSKEINNKCIDLAFYESLYYGNNFFIEKDYIKNNLYRIKNIEGFILHGRIDIICDFSESYEISKKLPKSKLIIQNYEGHWGEKSSKDYKNILNELVKKYYSKKSLFYKN